MIKRQLDNWFFKQKGKQEWLQAKVPGCVHTDLLSNGLIKDPFYEDNERELQWIDKEDWQYQTMFTLSEKEVGLNSRLVFHGLDTYTNIYLNGHEILATDNMFRTYKVDIRPFAKVGENELLITFRSPVKEDIPKLAALGYPLPASNDDSKTGGLGDQQISIFARKAPYHYGWDWGPRFVTSGIYRPVELVLFEAAKINDVYIQQDVIEEDKAELTIQFEVEVQQEGTYTFDVETKGVQESISVPLTEGIHQQEIKATIRNPKRWFTHDLGDPYLYDFSFVIEQEGKKLDQIKKKVGLRKVRLVREPDEFGESFYIELNDIPVFVKGANHIPNDSFITEVTYERFKREIESALFAHMNMLRVWGGGVYEANEFYQLCDEAGIMVWQDFMFACSMYPGDEAFLNNVEQEAIDQLRRLRNHPSIVLWCGNNEIDSAWAHYEENGGWGWKQAYTTEQREKIWGDYQKIFHGILQEQTTKWVPNEPYWPSSPMRKQSSDAEQHALKASGTGDLHYWEVWHGKQPFESYRENVSRFVSEYGFQSFPEKKTVDSFLTEQDYQIDSVPMLHHQKNGDGNHLIDTYMKEYLPKPKDFLGFLYMSQVLQADGIKHAIEAHRERKPFCMGTLYWQINDCWPVASWSSVDYYGRFKALHYQVRRSFEPILLTTVRVDDTLVVHGINDHLFAVNGTLRVQLRHLDGTVKKSIDMDLTLEKQSSQVLLEIESDSFLEGLDPDTHLLDVKLIKDTHVLANTYYYFVKTKDLPIQKGRLTIEPIAKHTFIVTSSVYQRALQLVANVEGYFSDNYFDLLPNESKIVEFYPSKIGEKVVLTAQQMGEMVES